MWQLRHAADQRRADGLLAAARTELVATARAARAKLVTTARAARRAFGWVTGAGRTGGRRRSMPQLRLAGAAGGRILR